jgi:hypothetical protein
MQTEYETATDLELNILLCGNIEKNSLVKINIFSPNNSNNGILEIHSKKFDIKNYVVNITFWNVCGPSICLKNLFYSEYSKTCAGAILLYDIHNLESFYSLDIIWKNISLPRHSVVVCGLSTITDTDRSVSCEGGESFANKIGASYHELLSDNTNNHEIFSKLITKMFADKLNFPIEPELLIGKRIKLCKNIRNKNNMKIELKNKLIK